MLFKKIVEGIGGSEIKRDLNILTKKGEEEGGNGFSLLLSIFDISRKIIELCQKFSST